MRFSSPEPTEILALYKREILKRTTALCIDNVSHSRDSAEALHLCGLLVGKEGNLASGIAMLQRAVVLRPRDIQYLTDLGDALLGTGRWEEAVCTYLRGLTLARNDARPYRSLGRALLSAGRNLAALAVFDLASRIAPKDSTVLLDRGDALRALGRLDQAVTSYEYSLHLNLQSADACARLGDAYLQKGAWDVAADYFRRGLAIDRRRADLHCGVGQAFLRAGDLEQAQISLRSAVALGEMKACIPLISVLERLEQRADVIGLWCWYGDALSNANSAAEAAIAYRQALSIKPDCVLALVGLGTAQLALREPEKAKTAFKAAIRFQSEHRQAHINYGQALHMCGDLYAGWRELAWYNRHTNVNRFQEPKWHGEPLNGKTILLWADFFLGDTIQLVRYVPFVKALGGRVLIQCDPILVPLLERMDDVDRVVSFMAPRPYFDVHAPFGELPRIFGTRATTIPSSNSYLTADTSLRDRWRQSLGPPHEMRIGLVWSGDRKHKVTTRFTSLSVFAPLAGTRNARFISLQLGGPSVDLLAPPDGLEVEKALSQNSSIDDTASLMMNLDLVISVDTMSAHLAGALGRPVWTLLPFSPDWRWHARGDRSPWYPTMRLFIQSVPNDWLTLMKGVRQALDECCKINSLAIVQ